MISFLQNFGTQTPESALSHSASSAACSPALMNADSHLTTPRIFEDEPQIANFSDEELERHITHCGIQMLAAHRLFRELKTIEMRRARRAWMTAQSKALLERSRRPQMVAAREAQIEARMAREPGATHE